MRESYQQSLDDDCIGFGLTEEETKQYESTVNTLHKVSLTNNLYCFARILFNHT